MWAINAEVACEALPMALDRRGNPTRVIVHSDRGVQYCSNAYQAIIQRHNLRSSISAKANCYDNACAESFFHSLKVEAIRGERFATREDARRSVFEYIDVDYNRNRLRSSNGYISPAEHEARSLS